MPASFAPEALRPQAVAARTYILQRVRGGAANHPEAGVCDQYTCCCARKDDAALREQWGADYAHNMARIRQAVTDGRAVSHLRRAAHPHGVPRLVRRGDREQRRALERRRAVSRERVLPRDGAGRAELRLDGRDHGRRRAHGRTRPLSGLRARRRPGTWFGTPVLDDSGRVACIPVGSETLTGAQVRRSFPCARRRFPSRTAAGRSPSPSQAAATSA